MYYEESGKLYLNDGALLLDLFCFANQNKVIVKNDNDYSILPEDLKHKQIYTSQFESKNIIFYFRQNGC